MPPGHLPGEVFQACPSGPQEDRTHWRDNVSRLAWESFGTPPDELDEVAAEREVWVFLLRLLPATLPRLSSGRWMDVCKFEKNKNLYYSCVTN